MQLSQKLKAFCGFILHFRNLGKILDIFRKKMTFIAYLFLSQRPSKNVVRYLCKKSRFRLSFLNEHGKLVSTLFKFQRHHLYHIYWPTRRHFRCGKSLLVIYESLRLFLNTVGSVDKCSHPNRDNLTQPIHMQLSQKLKTFSRLFSAFSKSTLNFEYFQKKDDAHSLFISEATACEKRG